MVERKHGGVVTGNGSERLLRRSWQPGRVSVNLLAVVARGGGITLPDSILGALRIANYVIQVLFPVVLPPSNQSPLRESPSCASLRRCRPWAGQVHDVSTGGACMPGHPATCPQRRSRGQGPGRWCLFQV